MFMRTETTLSSREVLAVFLKDCLEDFSMLPKAVINSKMGENGKKRDFLDYSAKEDGQTYITQGKNATRKSCLVIYLDTLPDDLAANLKKGNYKSSKCYSVTIITNAHAEVH